MEKYEKNLKEEADFMYRVYCAPTRHLLVKSIKNANQKQIDILIKTIGFLMSGKIPLREKKWKVIVKSKLLPIK